MTDSMDDKLSLKPYPNGKRCYKCKKKKALSEFHKNKKSLGGVTDACKLCKREEAYISQMRKLKER